MQAKTSVFLAEGIVIGAALIVLAALIVAFSPMLWTDHMYDAKKSIPTGCSVQPMPVVQGQTAIILVHCPSWVQY